MTKMNCALALCALGLTACSDHNEQKQTAPEEKGVRTFSANEMVAEKNRGVLRNLWIGDAVTVAQKSGDVQALQVSHFLQENSVLAEPEPRGVRFVEGAENNKRWFAIIPLVVGDENLGPNVRRFTSANDPGFAHFLPDQRAMIVKSHVRISPLWRGIITLHEGNHALEFISERYNWRDQKIFCEKERDTHNFQNRVTEKIGGESYRVFLASLASEIKQEMQKKGVPLGQGIWHRSHSFPELDAIFGPPESGLERDFRETSVWIHAYFVLYESVFGKDAEEKKALFLKTLYKGNVLPTP